MCVFDFVNVYMWQCAVWACLCFGVFVSYFGCVNVSECVSVYNWRSWVKVQWVWGCECVGLWSVCLWCKSVWCWKCVCKRVVLYVRVGVWLCGNVIIWLNTDVGQCWAYVNVCECQCQGYCKTGRVVWCVEMCGFSLTVDVFEYEGLSVFTCVSQSWVKVCVSGHA